MVSRAGKKVTKLMETPMKYVVSFLIFTTAVFVTPGAFAAAEGDSQAIQECLAHWGKHPFGKGTPTFRTFSSKVKVMGIGAADINDEQATDKPDLVLVKPNVTVMSKTELNLK